MKHLAMIFLVVCSTAQAQSPWVAEKGKGFFQLGYTTIGPYSELFGRDGRNYELIREVTDRTVQFYGEYSVTSKTAIITSIPYKIMETSSKIANPTFSVLPSGTANSFGNIQIAGRHNFINKNFVLSGQLLFEIPTGRFENPAGLGSGLDAFSILPSISVGKGFSNFYAFAFSGIALRTNDFSNALKIGAEAGYQVIKRVYIIAVLDIMSSLEEVPFDYYEYRRVQLIYHNDQSFFAYGLKTIIGFTDHIGISGAFYGAGSGHLVAKSPSINFGVYYKL